MTWTLTSSFSHRLAARQRFDFGTQPSATSHDDSNVHRQHRPYGETLTLSPPPSDKQNQRQPIHSALGLLRRFLFTRRSSSIRFLVEAQLQIEQSANSW